MVDVRGKIEYALQLVALLRIVQQYLLERLQNRYTHKIFSMDWLSGILKRVATIFGVWLAEKGV